MAIGLLKFGDTLKTYQLNLRDPQFMSRARAIGHLLALGGANQTDYKLITHCNHSMLDFMPHIV